MAQMKKVILCVIRKSFQARIDIVNVVAQTILLELQASGGRGYLKNDTSGFSRRWKRSGISARCYAKCGTAENGAGE